MTTHFHTLCIDADVVLHRAVRVAATSVTFDDISHVEVDLRRAGAYIREHLTAWKGQFGAKRVLLALGDRTGNFRKELSPTYKSNRTGIRPPGFMELEAKLKAHAKVVQLPRLEGDDCLGLMLTKLPDALCISIDKDMLQIPGHHYNPDTEVLSEVTPAMGKYLHYWQTLVGDRVDGYPGCPGVGKVKAERILTWTPGQALYGETEPRHAAWLDVVAAFEDAGLTEDHALLQARLAFVLRQGYYSTKTKEIRLWTPTGPVADPEKTLS